MAEPNDSASMLEDAAEIFQEQYDNTFDEMYHARFGRTTNKLFKPAPRPVTGDGENIQYEVGGADSVRWQTDPLGSFASPHIIDPGEIKLRWTPQTTSTHDFTQFTASVQFDIYTLENKSKGTVVNLVDRIYDSVIPDFDEKLAIQRHLARTGAVALVNGTPKENDRETMADATSTADNTDGLRCNIDTGSLASFKPNARYDFINPSTGAIRAGNVRCTDVPNFADKSVGWAFETTGHPTNLSTGNLADVADNDIICFSGTYNKNLWSFGSWFAAPTNDTNFITGANRTTQAKRWMIPQTIAAGSVRLTKSHFNQLAIAMGFLSEDPQMGVVWMMGPNQHQVLRDELTEAAFITWPTGDAREARFANFGSHGLNYQHPTFGHVKIVADPLAREDRVLALVNGTWRTYYWGWRGLRSIKDGGTHFYRMNQGTPNTGRGLIYAADWVGNCTDWCTQPFKNGAITGLSAPTV
jgi:hypothetical protein